MLILSYHIINCSIFFLKKNLKVYLSNNLSTTKLTSSYQIIIKMSALKVSNAINKLIYSEKVQLVEQLKMYMKEHVDEDDFSVSVGGDSLDLSEFFKVLDTFIEDSVDKKMLKIKTTTKTTTRPKKKQNFYNYWLANRLATFSKEQSLLDESERVDNKERMKIIGPEWKAFKESDEYEEQKKEWESNQASLDTPTEKTTTSKKTPKKAPKKTTKKAPKKSPKKKVESDSDSDSDSDNE